MVTIYKMVNNHCHGAHDDDDDDGDDGCCVVIVLVHVSSSHVSAGWYHAEATGGNGLSCVEHHDQYDYYSGAVLY